MRSDSEIREEVREELAWDLQIGARHVLVAVRAGVVTLTGFVRSPIERVRAEAAAKRTEGVLDVANGLEVRRALFCNKPDTETARALLATLRSDLPTVCERIRVAVTGGRASLAGEVDWQYQRLRAAELARRVRGIRTVSNEIIVTGRILAQDVRGKIEETLDRLSMIDSVAITVESPGDGLVVLKGSVCSWTQRAAAEHTARSAPGVTAVDNWIEVVAG
jgi:osmotically-inducible protein OsmY